MKALPLSLLTLAAVGLGWIGVASMKTASASPVLAEPIIHPEFDPERIDDDIRFNIERVKNDPEGALGWSMLSGAYLAKSREFDSDAAAWKAEGAARKSLALRRKNNVSAAKRLVQSLLEQHRFQDALKATAQGARIDPHDTSMTKLRVDILIEVGRYAEAEKALGSIDRHDPSFPTLRARLLSARGAHADAAALMQQALGQLAKNRDVRNEDLAWYEVKIGNELLANGNKTLAGDHYSAALKLHPRNYKARLGMAHLALARKDSQAAMSWGEKVLEVADSMEAKSVIAEAALVRGDRKGYDEWCDKIVEQFRSEDAKFEKLGKGGPLKVRPEDRAFATFCAKMHLSYPEALVAARRDAANRNDATAQKNLSALQR